MPPRLKAIQLLALYLVKTVGRRIFTRNKSGIAAFRANYDADGLPPVSLDEREEMPAFSGCIACGLCDRGEARRIEPIDEARHVGDLDRDALAVSALSGHLDHAALPDAASRDDLHLDLDGFEDDDDFDDEDED